MIYEVVIGVEVHAQLRTKSKMFCGCGTTFGLSANSQTCPVCLGLPGTLPVINQAAVEMAVRAGLALNCTISANNRFARKNYFYPDLPKGYQISQYESPICEHGWIEIAVGDGKKRVKIRRAHLEEDAGKNVHETGTSGSRVDLNRAGTPLLEIVTEPDMRSADEVVAYLKKLREELMAQEVCEGDMEKGNFRCEPNLSLRPLGQKEFGTKVELKNINSFKFVKDAIEYEIKRQTKVLNEGGKIQQETRLWNLDRGETAVMRSKEEAHDYRYFPDPDLVPLRISEEFIQEQREKLLEPREETKRRYRNMGLPDSIAEVIASDTATRIFFDEAIKPVEAESQTHPFQKVYQELAFWITGDLRNLQNKYEFDLLKIAGETNVHGTAKAQGSTPSPENIRQFVYLKLDGLISGPTAKAVLEKMVATGSSAGEIVKQEGLTQISDEGALEKIIDDVVAKNPAQVAQFKEGKQQVLGFLVGQVMKASGGKANPGKVNELLKRKLTA